MFGAELLELSVAYGGLQPEDRRVHEGVHAEDWEHIKEWEENILEGKGGVRNHLRDDVSGKQDG